MFLVPAACGRSDTRAAGGTPAQATEHGKPPLAVRYDAPLAAGGVAPLGDTLKNPFKRDRKAATRGAAAFTAMNCDGCHGGGALGWVGPSLVDGRWRYGGSDAAVFQSIYYGRPRGMPAYGGLLSPDVIWALVSYLESQPLPSDVPTESWH